MESPSSSRTAHASFASNNKTLFRLPLSGYRELFVETFTQDGKDMISSKIIFVGGSVQQSFSVEV
jgi:hypothetical protein